MSTLTPLVSSAAYGVSDYLGGIASRRSGALGVIAIAYPTSVVGMAILSLVVPGDASAPSIAWGAASGAVMAFAIWWFYLALAAGPISVVSPVTAVLVAAIPVVVGLLQGEQLNRLASIGIAVGLVAVVMVSCDVSRSGNRIQPSTLLFTIGAGALFALSFVLTAEIAAGSGIIPLLAARVVATVIVFAFLLLKGVPPRSDLTSAQRVRTWIVPICIGVVGVVANVAMYYTFQLGELALGSFIIALYPAFTVALAVVILHEHIHRIQLAGLVAAVLSVLLVQTGA